MERKFLVAVCAALMLAAGGCTANPAPGGKADVDEDVYKVSGMEISNIVSEMADSIYATMYANLQPSSSGSDSSVSFPKVAVTSFVDTDTYENAGYLGRALGEFFIHELDRRKIPVMEFKVTGNLSVSKDGDFVFSRDWKKLASKARVRHVLAGTLNRNSKGVVLVARVVDMQTSVVVGSATGFIPYYLLPHCYRTSEKNCVFRGVISYVTTADNRSGSVKKTTRVSKNSSRSASKNGKDSRTVGNTSGLSTTYYPANSRVPGTSDGNYQQYLDDSEDSLITNCTFNSCDSSVVYPATTYRYHNELIRDVHDQSQYDRAKTR